MSGSPCYGKVLSTRGGCKWNEIMLRMNSVKVQLISSNHGHTVIEQVWAENLGGGLYRLKNIPCGEPSRCLSCCYSPLS